MSLPTRRDFLGAGAAATLTACAAPAPESDGPARRPNLLLLFPDQWRPDWLGVNPAVPVRTPNVDALASRGVRFTKAVTASPLCAPGPRLPGCGQRV